MPYSQFNLTTVKKAFNLTTIEEQDLFAHTPKAQCSNFLIETLKYNIPLALGSNTEKARSEMIVVPVLIEARKQTNNTINLFSGIAFDVEPDQGLSGYCDFIFSHSPEKLFVTAPVVMLVEAKNENIHSGIGQCVAEMVAAQLLNKREENAITTIYGVVTSGTNWKFMRLTQQLVEIDLSEYYLSEIATILGILQMGLQS